MQFSVVPYLRIISFLCPLSPLSTPLTSISRLDRTRFFFISNTHLSVRYHMEQQQQQQQSPSSPFSSSSSPSPSPTSLRRDFDPPDKVVNPAFAELLSRLHKARTSPFAPADLAQQERVLFNYGVAQRRRVLEHTVLLIFGQYIIYRQFISKWTANLRPLRLAYGITSSIGTIFFMRTRATHATNDLFAHIATQDTDSALANEARIVLAEMEGPNGPYFKTICNQKGFNLLTANNSRNLSNNDTANYATIDMDQQQQHPQLKLTPRLLTDDVLKTWQLKQNNSNHPVISKRTGTSLNQKKRNAGTDNINDGEDDKNSDNMNFNYGVNNNNNNSTKKPSTIRMRNSSPGLTDLSSSSSSSTNSVTSSPEFDSNPVWLSTTPPTSTSTSQSMSKGNYNKDIDDTDNDDTFNWGKPYDFSSPTFDKDNYFDDNASNHDDDDKNANANLTPSQKRAAERQKKRMAARARASSSSSS